jgi:hypothetical protein
LRITRKETLDRIANYIAEQGYNILEKDFSENVIRFSNEGLEAIVRVVDEEANGGDLLSIVIQSAFDAAMGKIAYVALPIHLLSRIGDHAFRLHKIGLIVYSDQKITELVSGRAVQLGETKSSISELEKIEAMISSLASRVERVEESIKTLSIVDELNRRLENIERLVYEKISHENSALSKNIDQHVVKTEAYPEREETKVKRRKTGDLPSFIAENPWVDLLSERT